MEGQSTDLWFFGEEDARTFLSGLAELPQPINQFGVAMTTRLVALRGTLGKKPIYIKQYGVVIHARPLFDKE